jgi:hypothetical protein
VVSSKPARTRGIFLLKEELQDFDKLVNRDIDIIKVEA